MLYNPPDFQWTELTEIRAALRTARLATLVTVGSDGPEASHIPMLPDGDKSLIGHVARGNGHWKQIRNGDKGLVIYLGPEAYVTPSFYPSKKIDGQSVPTWNYSAIHVSGRLEIFDDEARLRDMVTKLTDHFETGRADPWKVTDAPEKFLKIKLRGIVGIRLEIERIEGKRKFSQNKSEADRNGVIDGMDASADARDRAMAKAMRDYYD